MPQDLLARPKDLLADNPPPKPSESITAKVGDWIVDNLGGVSSTMRRNAETGDFARDAANDDGFFDRAGSLIERGAASVDEGIYNFLGGLGSKKGRAAAATIRAGTTGQDILGTTGWDDVGGVGSLGSYVLDAGIESLPAMGVLAVPYAGPALIAGSQTGNIASERVANNNSGDITTDDLTAAAPAALLSTALDVFGLKGITNPVGSTIRGRVGRAAAREGVTEGIQSGIEYTGGSLGTEVGFDTATALDQMLAGGVAGAGIGGAVRLGVEPIDALRARRRPQPEQAIPDDTDWEGSLDDLLAPEPQDLLALPAPVAYADSKGNTEIKSPPKPAQNGSDVIRGIFGDKARITSGYRGPDHPLSKKNPNSWHARSTAAVDMAPIAGMTFEQAKAEIESRGYNLIEAINEVGKGRTKNATGDHWHFVIGQGDGPVGATPDNPYALDIPGADGSLLNRGEQSRIARLDTPEGSGQDYRLPDDEVSTEGEVSTETQPEPNQQNQQSRSSLLAVPSSRQEGSSQVVTPTQANTSGQMIVDGQAQMDAAIDSRDPLATQPKAGQVNPQVAPAARGRTALEKVAGSGKGQIDGGDKILFESPDGQVAVYRTPRGTYKVDRGTIVQEVSRVDLGEIAEIEGWTISQRSQGEAKAAARTSAKINYERTVAARKIAAANGIPEAERDAWVAGYRDAEEGRPMPESYNTAAGENFRLGYEAFNQENDISTQPDTLNNSLTNPPYSATIPLDDQSSGPDEQAATARPDRSEPDGGSSPTVPKLARGQLRALGIAAQLRTEKATALVGRTASTPRELAEIAQVYRDPRHETFRIFLTKGDTIVHATGVSSRLVNEAPLMPKDMSEPAFYAEVKQAMADSGADGYYLLHNHPSGDPTPSNADRDVTRQIAKNVPGLRAHVVINSNRYARIVVNDRGVSQVNTTRLSTDDDKLIKAAVPHDVIGRKILLGNDLAALGKELQKPGWITAIGVDAKSKVRVIVDYPASAVKKDVRSLMAMARRIQRQSGSASLFLIGERKALDNPTVKRAISGDIVTAAIDEDGKQIIGNKRNKRNKLPAGPARMVADPGFHGSPHIFDRFSTESIGTGEGAQAYGWGLYFSGKKEIAEFYRENLTAQRARDGGGFDTEFVVDGRGINRSNRIEYAAAELAQLAQSDEAGIVRDYGSVTKWAKQDIAARGIRDEAGVVLKAFNRFRKSPVERRRVSGRLYEVEIPNDGEYLLWDKPLSEQPEKVHNALERLTRAARDDKDATPTIDGTQSYAEWDALHGAAMERAAKVRLQEQHTGQMIYYSLGDALVDEIGNKARGRDKAASEALHAAGIAGIKYLDGSSRADGDGTFNYVVFDDSRIEITGVSEDKTPFKKDPGPKITNSLVDVDGLTSDVKKIRDVVGNPVDTLKAVMRSGLADNARALFYTMDSRMRAYAKRYDSKAITTLANHFHAQAGTGGGPVTETYHSAVEREGLGRAAQAHRILEPFFGNKAAMERITRMLRMPAERTRGKRTEAEAAAKIAKLLKDTLEYRREAGEDIGEVTTGYFPRMLDVEKVVKGRNAFLRNATELFKIHGAANPSASAEAWLARTFDQYAGIDGGLALIDLFHDQRPAGVGRSTTKSRKFGEDAERLLSDFYQNDTGEVLNGYFIGGARKAEEARRFGGEKLKELFDQIKEDIRKSGEDGGDVVESLAGLVATNLGRLGTPPERYRATTSFLHTAGQLGTLDRATITSLSEAMMGFVRGGARYGLPMVIRSAREFARQIRKMPPSEAARMAEVLGIAQDAIIGDALAARAGFERANTTRAAQNIQKGFFRATGLEQWTNGTRIAATSIGQELLRQLATDFEAGKVRKSTGYLNELGITNPKEFSRWLLDGGNPTPEELITQQASPMAREYRTALVRFANQTIMKPNRAEKPRWASHPVGSMFFSLMSFSYGFKKNVLDRTGRMTLPQHKGGNPVNPKNWDAPRWMKEGDPSLLYPAFGLAALLATHTVINNVLRQAIFGGGREDDEEGISFVDWIEAMDRAGLFGAASPLINAVFGVRYDRSLTESFAGPVIGRPADAATKIVNLGTDRNSDNTNNAERAAAAALYDVVLEPAMEAYGVTRLKGVAAAGVVWGSGNREGGIVPPDRDAFVNAVAGPKE